MRRVFSTLVSFTAVAGLALSSSLAVELPPPASRQVDFVKDIKPLFESSCVKCHAKGKTKGDFSLETRAAFILQRFIGNRISSRHSADHAIG